MNVHFDGPASKWTFTKDIDVEKMTTFKKVTKNEKRAKMFLSHFSLHTQKKLIFKEMLLLKTNFRMKGERRQMLEWKKNEEISKVLYVLSFGLQLEMKLVQTVFISIGVKIRQALYT